MSSTAAFSITASASTDIGYDATNSEVLTLTLEASPALDVHSVAWSISQKSNGANVLTFSDAAPQPPTTPVTLTMPATGWHSWVIRCVVNGGVDALGNIDPALTSERLVAILSGAGLRKIVPAERTQYDATDGWSAAFNDAITASGGGTTAGITAAALTGTRFNLAIGTAESQLQDIIDQLAFAGAHTFAGLHTLDAGLTLATQSPFAITSTGIANVDWTMQQSGAVRFIEQTTNKVAVAISPGASAGVDLLKIGLTRIELDGNATPGAERFLYINNYSGSGTRKGANMSFQAQRGQNASGANNDGGDFLFYPGAAGTGGTGVSKLGKIRQIWGGPERISHALAFANISTTTTNFYVWDIADGESVAVNVRMVCVAGSGARSGEIERRIRVRRTGGVAVLGTPTDKSSDYNTTGTLALPLTLSAGSNGLQINIDPGGDTVTGMLYIDIEEAT